jgi:ATP-binding protein involved in chromosome partitioning
MTDVTERDILAALAEIPDPDRGGDIVALGMVQGLQIRDGHVAFMLQVDAERGNRLEPLRKQAEQKVHALPGVLTATVALTAERAPESGAGAPHAEAQSPRKMLPGVATVIAVASGKGGVGKSTTAVNLALALKANGHTVGLMDADVYGPSIPRMLGVHGKPTSPDGVHVQPMMGHGIACMSIGFFVEEDTPMIWRGPMATGALEQLLTDVDWGELDVLVVDLPPGTGDIHLSMAQRVPLTGAVIVSTPQDIALADARKGLNMFRKVDVPVLGLIENMSYFLCPHCGERTDIFSHGGARAEAERLGVDFLGEIPLDVAIRETSDGGNPITVSDPDHPHAKAYRALAERLWTTVERVRRETAEARPNIVVQ